MLTSYAQNFEDVMLWRALKDVDRGFYIDIGAQDPVIDSVSMAFYERGWRGILVEPSAQYAGRLRKARPDELVLEVAISEKREQITFFEVADSGLSTGVRAIAEEHKSAGFAVSETKVDALPFSEVLDMYKDRPVHWLKIDVEGMERIAIESWLPSSVRPWVVLVESTKPNSPDVSYAEWEPSLLALGYSFVYFDGLNRYYVAIEHSVLAQHFSASPNYFDDFSLTSKSWMCRIPSNHIHGLEQQLAASEQQLAASEQQLAASEQQLAATKQQLTASEQRSSAFSQQVEALQRSTWLAQEELARLRSEKQALELIAQEFRLVVNSRSWRLTRPLRFAIRIARRLRQRTAELR